MTTITALPTPPSRDDPTNFASRADDFLGALPTFVTETNAVASETNTAKNDAQTAASNAQGFRDTASTHATTATTKASEATASAASALSAPGTQATSTTSLAIGTGSKSLTIQTGKAYSIGQSVIIADSAAPSTNWMWGQITSHDSGTGALVVNVTAIGGSGTKTAWTIGLSSNPAAGTSSIVRSARTGNTILGVGDNGKLIDITSGTFTQTFTAAATLGNGWYCYFRNSGAGDITLDPNASETIDGVTSGPLKPGMTILISCDGSAFHAVRIGPQAAMEVLTSGTSWTCPIAVRAIRVKAIGGGSSGGKSATANAAMSGAAGAYAEWFTSVTPGTVYTYSIGAGGAGQSVAGSPGADGGSTAITIGGNTCTAGGATAGAASGGSGAITAGGSPSGTYTIGVAGRDYFRVSIDAYATAVDAPGAPVYGSVQAGSSGAASGYGAGSIGTTSSQNSSKGGDGAIVLEY